MNLQVLLRAARNLTTDYHLLKSHPKRNEPYSSLLDQGTLGIVIPYSWLLKQISSR